MKVLAVPSDEEFDTLPPALRKKVCGLCDSYYLANEMATNTNLLERKIIPQSD